MPNSERPRPRKATLTQAELAPRKRMLAAIWVMWSFWLVFRPVKLVAGSTVTPEARRLYAIMGFGLVFVIAWGLLRDARWPVTASRALVAALVIGVVVGPAGRDSWVYVVDVLFAGAGVALAFVLIRMGPRTLAEPRAGDDFLRARTERMQTRRRR